MPEVLPNSTRDQTEENIPRRPLARVTSLLWVIVIAIALAFGFFASSLCITFLLAAFLAIVVDPVVTVLQRFCASRGLSAAIVILVGTLLAAGLSYASYDKVDSFIDSLPQYAEKIRVFIKPLTDRLERVQESAGRLNPAPKQQKTPPQSAAREPFSLTPYFVRGVGSVAGAIIVGAVVPFLMFFMLARKNHIYWWLATTFEGKTDVAHFVERVRRMVQGFVVGNLIVGSIIGLITVAVLLGIHLEGALIVGMVSGFLNLVPYIGAPLALLLPISAATLQFGSAGPFLAIVLTILSLHLISANVLIPRLVGSRLNIDPVAAMAGMLFWAWLWGAFGLLLAVPLTAFVKLVADCHPSLIPISNLLAKNPRPAGRWGVGQGTISRAIPFLRNRLRSRTDDK